MYEVRLTRQVLLDVVPVLFCYRDDGIRFRIDEELMFSGDPGSFVQRHIVVQFCFALFPDEMNINRIDQDLCLRGNITYGKQVLKRKAVEREIGEPDNAAI